MDTPSACRVVYIDDRFHTEKWLSRDGLSASAQRKVSADLSELPPDLRANVNAILSVFIQGKNSRCFRLDCGPPVVQSAPHPFNDMDNS